MMFTLGEARSWIDGAKLVGDPQVVVDAVCTDSRLARPGELFVALIGERFDAHAFIGQVIGAGVRALISSREISTDARIEGELRRGVIHGLQVPDTTRALQQLAAGWRRRFDLPVIAVTGSNGKTTVKEMIASILREAFAEAALWSEGNLNNGYGVPLSVLRLRAMHRAAVLSSGSTKCAKCINWLRSRSRPLPLSTMRSANIRSSCTALRLQRARTER